MKIHNKGLYKVLNSSLYVRILKLQCTDGIKVKYKLQFEYKNGMIVERKIYTVELKNIQHWIKI